MRKINLLILGDYLPTGYDWQARVPQFDITNLAENDATSTSVLKSLPEIQETHRNTDAIMLMIGANDLLAGNGNYTVTVQEIGIKILGMFPSTDLLITSMIPLETEKFSMQEITKMNEHMAATAMHIGGVFLDIFTPLCNAIKNGQKILLDGTHLTDTGYSIWAKTMLEHIAFLVEEDD